MGTSHCRRLQLEISKQKIGRRKSTKKQIKCIKLRYDILYNLVRKWFLKKMTGVGKRKDIMEDRLWERARRCMWQNCVQKSCEWQRCVWKSCVWKSWKSCVLCVKMLCVIVCATDIVTMLCGKNFGLEKKYITTLW